MNDSELAERNYKVGVKILRNSYKEIDRIADKLAEILSMITYGKDGVIMKSVINKLQKSATQLEDMILRFDEIKGEIMVPYNTLYMTR